MPEVLLRGKEFSVAEHGAEVFGWAAKDWEKPTFEFLDRVLTPETTFLDLGAWIGVMSLYASGKCRRILAVEPDPVAFKTLEDNCAGIAHLRQVAIAGEGGAIRLGSGMLGASTTRANPAEGRGIGPWETHFESACMTLPQFATLEQVESPIAIKIDVEGMEEEILASSVDFFREHKPALFVELHPYWWKDQGKTWKVLEDLSALYNGAKRIGEHIAFGS